MMSYSKYNISKSIFLLLFLIVSLLYYLSYVNINWIIFLLIAYTLAIAFGSYYLRFGFYLKSKSKLDLNDKSIALTFDDGPNSSVTPLLIEILEKHDIKATFFAIGKNIEQNKELAKLIVEKGHILANHSYSHKFNFPLSPKSIVCDEIQRTNQLIEEVSSKKNSYFRPPFGVMNPIIARVVYENNLKVIGWNLRSYDTVISKEKLIFKLKRSLRENSIVLLHERESTVSILEQYIVYAKSRGYKFVLV